VPVQSDSEEDSIAKGWEDITFQEPDEEGIPAPTTQEEVLENKAKIQEGRSQCEANLSQFAAKLEAEVRTFHASVHQNWLIEFRVGI